MKLKTYLLSILLFSFLINNMSGQTEQTNFDYGEIDNNIYKNSFFNFTINIPTDWAIQNKEQIEALKRHGEALMAGDNAQMKAILKASEINSAILLGAFKYELGSAVEYNPGISIVVENIKNFPGIKSGNEYLYQARRIMKNSQIKYDHIDEEFEKIEIDGLEFYRMNAEMNYMELNIKQIYHSTTLNGFGFSIIVSFVKESNKEELMNILKTVKFRD